MVETLNINRERRALRVLERLDKRRSQGKFDFTIIVGMQKILAEQNVLASGSDYFEAMLSHDTKERQTGEVELMDADFESVETCVAFIYGREVTVSLEKYEKLMFVAHMMQLEELCDAMEEEMTQRLSLKTFFTIRSLALKFSLAGLVYACECFAEGNLGSLCMDESFNTLEKAFIIEMMKSERVEMEEEDKMKIVVGWVKHDVERSKILLELLKCIDISKISKAVMQYYVKEEPLINANVECLRFFLLSTIDSQPPQSKKKRILMFGKESQNLKLYSPDDNSIRSLHISNPNNNCFSVVCLHDYIYCLCKDKSVYCLRYRYTDLGTNWERIKDMERAHGWCPPAAVLSGRVYVIGGHNGVSSSAVECYNPWNDNWQLLESLPHEIHSSEVLASEGYIYRFGGFVGSQYVKDVARLDILTSQWETLPPMNECKGFVSAVNCKGMIYVAGGFTSTSKHLKTFESYNPSTNQWTVFPQMKICRSYFNLFAVGRFLYAVGGYNSSPDSIERYDIESGEWKMEIESSEEKLCIATSVAIEV